MKIGMGRNVSRRLRCGGQPGVVGNRHLTKTVERGREGGDARI